MRRISLIAIFIILFFLVVSAESSARVVFEHFRGTAYSFPSPVKIEQSGESDLTFTGRWKERGFDDWPSSDYVLRIGLWKENRGWEFEIVHHKIYLTNGPSEVQRFSISHGYNLFTINRAWQAGVFVFHLGAGPVITHPESTVRGKSFPEDGGFFSDRGYYFSGATALFSVGPRIYLWKWLFLTVDGKLSLAWVRVPIEDGHANVPNAAVHIYFGAGLDF